MFQEYDEPLEGRDSLEPVLDNTEPAASLKLGELVLGK